MKQTEIKKPVVSATGKARQIIGANSGDCSPRKYRKVGRQKQRFNIDNYLRDVLRTCNSYADSESEAVDAERFLNDWPSLPVRQKIRRGLQ